MKSLKLFAGAGIVLAGLAATAMAQNAASPTPPAQSQQAGPRAQWNEADRAAFIDSRMAGMKAALKLNADQEKNWPALETALRNAAQERMAMRDTMRQRRDEIRAGGTRPDAIAAMRTMSGLAAQRAQSITKIADAAEPLYRSLDESQKRRFDMMLRRAAGGERMMGRGMGEHRGWRH